MSCRCLVQPWAKRCFPSRSPTLRPWITDPRFLDRRPSWRGFGARSPARLSEKSELKHTHYFLRHFRRQAPSDLSLSGGASIRTRSFQAEHHLWSSWTSPSERKRRPVWGRPRLARYAARGLARIPPSEGSVVSVPKLRDEAGSARQAGDGVRRFGWELLAVDGDQHRFGWL
jgi:hypothetical protein